MCKGKSERAKSKTASALTVRSSMFDDDDDSDYDSVNYETD